MNVFTKKYASSSDESIENLLYFKDCRKNNKNVGSSTPPPFERLVAPPKPRGMDCPFPKMCCSLTCDGGNECNGQTSPFFGQQGSMGAEQVYPPIGPLSAPLQPQVQLKSKARKKKLKQPMRIQIPPMPSARRNYAFTKDKIKNLINQDDDIRKILKDLVRVTMQKVDLVDKIKMGNAETSAPLRPMLKNSDVDDDDDDDLE